MTDDGAWHPGDPSVRRYLLRSVARASFRWDRSVRGPANASACRGVDDDEAMAPDPTAAKELADYAETGLVAERGSVEEILSAAEIERTALIVAVQRSLEDPLHLGARVLAEALVLNPVDRILVR